VASVEESKELPANSGKLTFTIESAKIQNFGKNSRVSVEFEWSGENLKTSQAKGSNPKWNEVSSIKKKHSKLPTDLVL
jgi:hypothetical protein